MSINLLLLMFDQLSKYIIYVCGVYCIECKYVLDKIKIYHEHAKTVLLIEL